MCEEKSTQARNAYLLQLASANAHQNRYFHVDLQNVVKVRFFHIYLESGHFSCCSLFLYSSSSSVVSTYYLFLDRNVVTTTNSRSDQCTQHAIRPSCPSIPINGGTLSISATRQIEFSSQETFTLTTRFCIVDSRWRNVRKSRRVFFHPQPDGALHLLRIPILFRKDQRTSHDGIF